jgi:hypothetical protein
MASFRPIGSHRPLSEYQNKLLDRVSERKFLIITFCPYTGDIFPLKNGDRIFKKKNIIYKISDGLDGFY